VGSWCPLVGEVETACGGAAPHTTSLKAWAGEWSLGRRGSKLTKACTHAGTGWFIHWKDSCWSEELGDRTLLPLHLDSSLKVLGTCSVGDAGDELSTAPTPLWGSLPN
jgi:hypothetical protein